MGILVRSGPLSHPTVRRLIADHFVPVAIDIARFRQVWGDIRETAKLSPGGLEPVAPPDESELALFRSIEQQDSMPQGVWMTTPDGTLLRSAYCVTPHPMLSAMKAAIAEWQDLTNAAPLPLRAASESSGESTLTFYGRLLDGGSHVIFRDSALLSAEQWLGVLPDSPRLGQSFEVPQAVLQVIASRIYPGEMRLIIRSEEIKHVAASMTVRAIENGIALADLRGSLEVVGSFPFSTRRRQHEANLTGELRWRLTPPELLSVQLVSDGKWQGDYPEGRLSASTDIYPGGMIPGGQMAMSPPMRLLFLVEMPERDVFESVAQFP